MYFVMHTLATLAACVTSPPSTTAPAFSPDSLYGGIGLPVLEAMACGTLAVTSSASSLPEVAGDAAIQVDPYNGEVIHADLRRVLAGPDLAADLREKSLARAAQIT